MARASAGRRKKARQTENRTVAVSPTPQTGTAPFVADTSSWDAAAQLVAQKHRGQTAALRAQTAASPDFPGNISAQPASATLTLSPVVADAMVTAGQPLYQEVLGRLDELETTVERLRPLLPSSAPGIGHNNPPPLSHADLDEIKTDIALLKAQPPPAPADANKVANKFVHFGVRVLSWVGKQLDTFVTEFMKSAGKTAGATVGLSPLWLTFGQQLGDTATAVLRWLLKSLGAGP